jgi:D-arabinose 1-dehydrogenase-like Zn-dependent alcohol dehydrogenase
MQVVINTVSSKNDYEAQMALLRADGTLCIVGLPVDKITVGVLDVVFNQKKVLGVNLADVLIWTGLFAVLGLCTNSTGSTCNGACFINFIVFSTVQV